MWPRREQVLQLGLMPSHFSFRFLQIMQARRFGLGTLELPPAGASTVIWSPSGVLSAAASDDTMMVSGGVSDDMAAAGVSGAVFAHSSSNGEITGAPYRGHRGR